MNLLLGVGILAAAALLFGWAFGRTRDPVPPGWTRRDNPMISITIVFAGLFTLGIGFAVTAALNLGGEVADLGPIGVVAVLLIAAGGVWMTRRLSRRRGLLPVPPAMLDPRGPAGTA